MKIQRPKGTEDLYGDTIIMLRNVINKLVIVAKQANYQELVTPVFESAALFLRAIGTETEIINKEIYQFTDKKNRALALRPEATASVIRAVIENKLYTNTNNTQKYFYYGSMYRYERPQRGRNREFYQFGIEALGNSSAQLDVEIIALAVQMLAVLHIKNYTLEINFFGSKDSKLKFKTELVKKLDAIKTSLCLDCQTRIVDNAFRVLDCKIDGSKNWGINIEDFYTDEDREYFLKVQSLLKLLAISYIINNNLVRGLDYYTGIIFEFVTNNAILGKSQNTIIGGGRYDNLCQDLGLPYYYPAIGFACGLERIMLLIKENHEMLNNTKLKLLIITTSAVQLNNLLLLSTTLQKQNFAVESNLQVLNNKQVNKIISSTNNSENILVIHENNNAVFYDLYQQKKEVFNFSDNNTLFIKVKNYLDL